MTRSSVVLVVSIALTFALAPSASAVAPPQDRYIVVLKDSADSRAVARDHARAYRARVHTVYGAALEGYAATIPAGRLAALRRDRRVDYVEVDGIARAVDTTQANATWGLDRIDQRARPLSGTYTYANTGSGVTAYIIDTGIQFSHSEFGGRASSAFDAVDGGSADDCDGHGTHVAGTVGGSTYGVAKQVRLKAVRVLDCSGSGYWSWVIAGINHVTANAQRPAVANMSLGGGVSSSVDQAVANSIASGVQYSIAAGNGNRGGKQQDACDSSPARVAEAMTISATNSSDQKASWANYGSCVDFFAPGVSITSAVHTSNSATDTWSGTSMAAPHAAGAAALHLESNPLASAQEVRDALFALTTKGIVSASSTLNNHLLYTVADGGSTTPAAPVADFTYSCTDLTCSFSSTSSGSVTSHSWAFGDGSGGSGASTSHTYSDAGTYTVTLTVSGDGRTDSEAKSVTVTTPPPPPTGGFTLGASAYKVKGVHHADLSWSGTDATSVDVYRDGARVATTGNDGAHTDNIGNRGGGSYTYVLCEAGTSTCSNESTIVF